MTKDGQTYNFLVDDKYNVIGIDSGSATSSSSSSLIGDFTPTVVDNSDGTITVSVPTDVSSNSNVVGYTYIVNEKVVGYTTQTNLIVTTENIPLSQSYNIRISATDINGNVKYSSNISKTTDNIKYAYTGKYQTLKIAKDGRYKIECWGASGGDARLSTGGNGAYTSGEISLVKGTSIYIYVGEKGKSGANVGFSESWNGGGKAIFKGTNLDTYSGSGGGSTDVRISNTTSNIIWNELASLSTRIMVAAGGGGGGSWQGSLYTSSSETGGAGGGLIGYISGYEYTSGNTGYTQLAKGGTQIAGGDKFIYASSGQSAVSGIFGLGGANVPDLSAYSHGSGGGGGWYGGGGGAWSNNLVSGGGGGSSYISGMPGCIGVSNNSATAKTSTYTNISDSQSYTGYMFSNTTMIDGDGYLWTTIKAASVSNQPTTSGIGTQKGQDGNGYCKITYLGN